MSSSALTSKRALPRIAITAGEPAGIGPDLISGLNSQTIPAELVVIGDLPMLTGRATQLARDTRFIPYGAELETAARAGCLQVVHIAAPQPVIPGRLDPGNAGYVLATLERALRGCLSGEFDAMVTGPIQKSVINDAGYPFTGHTEFLADRAGHASPVMMLVAGGLRVALATTHLSLRRVPDALTFDTLRYVITTVAEAIRQWFGIPTPRLAVCGLNPHAGEGGHLGREEIDLIAPAIAACRHAGWHVDGPLPADTAFTPVMRAKYDAYISMFHDQGLPVLKALGFGHAVNVTLGLPFIRTSVDHGTALDLAGTGQADPGSLHAALELAIKLHGHA